MSADAALLPCPICSHTGVFESVQSLQDRLICVSTKTILCPVCQDEVIGLDKLIVHLFSHVHIQQLSVKENVQTVKNKGACKKQDSANCSSQQKKPKATGSKNKTQASTSTSPVKYVKIYPKLPAVSINTMPFIDISSQGPVENGIKKSNPMHGSVVKAEAQIIQANTTCNVCNIQFVDENILKMHKCLIHNIEDSTEQSLTRYQCHICPKNFKMRGSLMVHLRVAHFGFSSDKTVEKDGATLKCKGGNSDEILDNTCGNLERSDSKQWQCDVCRKSFTTKYFLKKHKRLHTGETPYACTQCNKTFTFQQSYHKHLLYHNDEKPHTCSFCGRAFKELSTLHNHQRIHTGEKPFSCETCGKSFRQRVSYLVHRRIHTGVMPYKCTACNKNFRYKVSQRTHKCPAQPPGTVIRQSGDLLEKLKRKHANDLQTKSVPEPNENIKYPEVSEANAELVRCGAKLSLEDTETENFTLIEEAFNNNNSNVYSDFVESDVQTLRDMNESNTVIDKNMPSPSEILKNLCLSKEDEDTISNNVHENEIASNYCEYDDLFTSNKILFM